jgi:mono/diheme cytochrome c family protein
MLSTFNDEQLELVYHVINPEHWAMRFNRNPKDVELVKQVAQEAKL